MRCGVHDVTHTASSPLPQRPLPSAVAASNSPRTSARVGCELLLEVRRGARLALLGRPSGRGEALGWRMGGRSGAAAPLSPLLLLSLLL